MSDKSNHKNILRATAAIIAVVALVAYICYIALRPKDVVIEGLVEVNEYKVSANSSGRILEIRVEEGDYVNVGDTLVVLDSPEANVTSRPAAVSQEQISAAFEVLQQTKASLDLAMKSYNHMQKLFDDGVINQQKRDEAYANYKAMEAQVKAAQSQYDMVRSGVSREVLVASRDGEVGKIFPDTGDLVDAGTPIIIISVMKDLWATFNVPESQLADFSVGKTIHTFVPAFNKEFDFKVFHIKSSEVKARPVGELDGLRPGMAVVVKN